MIVYNSIRTANEMPGYYQFIATDDSSQNVLLSNTNAWRYLGPTYKVYGE